MTSNESENMFEEDMQQQPRRKTLIELLSSISVSLAFEIAEWIDEEIELVKSCDLRFEEHDAGQEKVWMKFIEDWQPGQVNSGLGQALQDKFEIFNKEVSNGN